MSNLPTFTTAIKNQRTTLTDVDGTTPKIIYTAGSSGSIITHVTLTTDNTTDLSCFLHFGDGSGFGYLGWGVVPSNSGTDGASAAIPFLALDSYLHRRIDNNANPYVELAPTFTLALSVFTAVEAGKVLYVTVSAQDY